MYKRRYPSQGKRQPQRKYSRRGSYTPNFSPGYTRPTGFYGRYNRASLRKSSVVNELKFKDTELVASEQLVAAVYYPLLTNSFLVIPTGTGPSERIGRQISVKSISGRVKITKKLSNDSSTSARLIWVVDSQCNGTKPLLTDLLTPAGSSYIHAYRNMANVSRFTILKDSTYTLTSSTLSASEMSTSFAEVTKIVKFYKKLNLPIEYDSTLTTGAITTIKSNNLLLCIVTDDNSELIISGNVRVRYDD
ncbi:MAG: coat protein/nuclear export [Cressdnaviricota sp.]|nr:MAG: coat protein/nuclear export [Cressdnaviricota sp.]